MANERVSRPPLLFSFVGIDYFEPMDVKTGKIEEKRYGAEILESLTTYSAILARRRFVARRRQPLTIKDDNVTHLISVKDLKNTFNEYRKNIIREK